MSVLLVSGLVASLAPPVLGQAAAPTIAFLNPSSFAEAGPRGIIVSDQTPDTGPDCCEGARGGYRLSAWVANAPPGSNVFFSVTQRTLEQEITDTEPRSANTWETEWDIPVQILDGPATLFAYLVLNEEPIAVARQDVTILRLQENVEITYPDASGSFGTYSALATALPESEPVSRKLPAGTVDSLYTNTPEMSYVKTVYTTSSPGSVPEWHDCGVELIGDSSNSRADNGVRCTLADPSHQTAITAIGSVANDSPDDYDERFNQSSDAVSVADAYAQQPTKLRLTTPGAQRVEAFGGGQFPCSTNETVQLLDQVGRQVASANVDVHAVGPNDGLKFHTFSILTTNKPPDRGAHAEEPGYDCTGQTANSPPGNANPSVQGDHPRFGAPDRKHIETLPAGTSDTGTFSFRFHTTSDGITDYTAWVDEGDDGCLTNDDLFTEGELYVDGVVGWGKETFVTTTQPYQPFAVCTPVDPSASPVPTVEPTVEPVDGSRSISVRFANRRQIRLDKPADFVGEIEPADPSCAESQRVVLKARRPGSRFWTKGSTTTDMDGNFTISVRAHSPRDYRAIAPATDLCERARSSILRLRK